MGEAWKQCFFERNEVLDCFICIAGLFWGMLWVIVWEYLPEKWLCDYGQEPKTYHTSVRITAAWAIPVMIIMSGLSLLLWFYGNSRGWFDYFTQMCFTWVLLQITAADWNFHIIPDQWILAIVLLTLVQILRTGRIGTVFSVFLGGLLIAMFLWTIANFLSIFFKQEVLGFGDVKLFFALGLYFGFSGAMWVLAMSIIFCGLGCALFLFLKVYQRDSVCAFAPYITVACLYFLMK